MLSYLHLNFDVLHAATNNRYADNTHIRLANLEPVGLFSHYKLTTSSGKYLKDISHADFVPLLYKLLSSAKDTDELSMGFDRNRDRRQLEMTNNKKIKGKYHVGIMLKDIFGFVEHQEKATYGFGYKLTITKNSDNAVLNKDNAVNDAKIKLISIEWYVPHYAPSIKQQGILMNQILSKTLTELQSVERSVFMKEVNT